MLVRGGGKLEMPHNTLTEIPRLASLSGLNETEVFCLRPLTDTLPYPKAIPPCFNFAGLLSSGPALLSGTF